MVDESGMVPAAPATNALARVQDQGEIDAQIAELFSKGKSVAEVVQQLRVPVAYAATTLAQLRQVGAVTLGSNGAGHSVVGGSSGGSLPRQDYVFCGFCDANKAQHFRGEGRNPITGCPRFQEPHGGT